MLVQFGVVEQFPVSMPRKGIVKTCKLRCRTALAVTLSADLRVSFGVLEPPSGLARQHGAAAKVPDAGRAKIPLSKPFVNIQELLRVSRCR